MVSLRPPSGWFRAGASCVPARRGVGARYAPWSGVLPEERHIRHKVIGSGHRYGVSDMTMIRLLS